VAQVSGALTGTSLPPDAHVALVWRVGNSNKWVVANDAPLVDGKFSFDVAPPPAEYFARSQDTLEWALFSPMDDTEMATASADASAPVTEIDSGVKTQSLRPLDGVSGGIGDPSSLESALAGFVVYIDKNGNGRLDVGGEYVSSPDEMIGGNRELLVTYFRGGGALDYEKLRDKAGVLPHAGCNLGWTQQRWLPTDTVELKLAENRLPYEVCSRFTTDDPNQVCIPNTEVECYCANLAQGRAECAADGRNLSLCQCDPGAKMNFPRPDDPRLHCLSGGGWSFDGDPTCPTDRLCNSHYSPLTGSASCSTNLYGGYFDKAPTPVPQGWPCPVTP
jgi:hypothetical protein